MQCGVTRPAEERACYNFHVRGRPWFRHLAGALLAGVVIGVATIAAAQTTARIDLTEPSTTDFPRVTFYASVVGPDGFRIHALPPTSFLVTEDGQAISDFDVTEESIGARQIYALNSVEALRRRDALGVTRLDQVRQALIDAWEGRPASSAADDISLLTATEALISHRSAAREVASAFEAWSATFAGPETGYEVLLEALNTALDPLPHPGMETSVVFLTPLLDQPNEQSLANARSLADSRGAAIHAVLIGTPEQAGTAEALRLRQVSEATGGTFQVFDPDAGLVDLEATLQDVRTRYAVEFTSEAATGGPHAVELSVTTEDLTAVSEAAAYTIRLEPPQVTFIQPPTRIVRQTEDPDRLLTDIPPTSIDLPVLISFPDGNPRPITALRFLANGAVVETRSEPPFESVRWDISSIVEGSRHQLQVEITDSQGLTATTEILPVTVEVIPGPRGLEALRPALAPLAASVAIVALGIAGIAAWIHLGEVPVAGADEDDRPGALRNLKRASLGVFDSSVPAEAFLVPLHPDGRAGPPIALQGTDLTIGSDAAICTLLLDDPSVSGIHAKLTRRAPGTFTLRDQHSVAGTWLNDDAVDETGRELNHGDRIHFGRAAYRFRLASPGPEPRVIIRSPRGEDRQ